MSKREAERARSCPADEITSLLSAGDEQVIEALIENPFFEETHLVLLLERRELGTTLLERVVRRKEWLSNRRVRLGVVAHPHAPRRVVLRLAREIAPMDLVALSLRPAVPPEVRRFAEELLLGRVAHLPLGQKLTLARQGPGRVAAALLADGGERVARIALDNSRLTEAMVLRALASSRLSERAINEIGSHSKWAVLTTIQASILRHPHAPVGLVAELAGRLTQRDLRDLSELGDLREEASAAIRLEMNNRRHRDAAKS